jgi:hypothetical protein
MKETLVKIIKKIAHNPSDVSPTFYKIGTAIYLILIVMAVVFTITVYSFSGQLKAVQENLTNICVSTNMKAICDTLCDSGECYMKCGDKNITLDDLPYQNFTLQEKPWLNSTELAEKCNKTHTC